MLGLSPDDATKVKERRMFDRLVARLPIRLFGSEQDFSTDVYLRDISASGAKLITRERLIPQEKINFWVQIPDGKDPLPLEGKVVWAKETERDVWDTGISFEKIRLMDLHRVFSL
ncbi:MAG: PilZ domain-containing protein [Candidatus Omnitrophota bacterium]|nr:PilZ domain-containing protein [Candidatus Omnitrophota bacterium]